MTNTQVIDRFHLASLTIDQWLHVKAVIVANDVMPLSESASLRDLQFCGPRNDCHVCILSASDADKFIRRARHDVVVDVRKAWQNLKTIGKQSVTNQRVASAPGMGSIPL